MSNDVLHEESHLIHCGDIYMTEMSIWPFGADTGEQCCRSEARVCAWSGPQEAAELAGSCGGSQRQVCDPGQQGDYVAESSSHRCCRTPGERRRQVSPPSHPPTYPLTRTFTHPTTLQPAQSLIHPSPQPPSHPPNHSPTAFTLLSHSHSFFLFTGPTLKYI